MNPDTTPTPRTDAKQQELRDANPYWFEQGASVNIIPRSFAEQLERELAEKTNEVAMLRAENSQLEKELTKSESDQLEIEDINGWIDSEYQIANQMAKKAEAEVERLRQENALLNTEVDLLKQGKVFVDPKWIYNLETQLAKAHEELCQAGLREYGN
jgi:cell division protein FtsB